MRSRIGGLQKRRTGSRAFSDRSRGGWRRATAPDDLGARLNAAGLQQADTELAMSLDLAMMTEPRGAPEALEIRRVRSQEELRDYAIILAANWTPPDAHVVRFYEMAADALLTTACPIHLYIGYENGVAVSRRRQPSWGRGRPV